jgi:hypothetical protein
MIKVYFELYISHFFMFVDLHAYKFLGNLRLQRLLRSLRPAGQ